MARPPPRHRHPRAAVHLGPLLRTRPHRTRQKALWAVHSARRPRPLSDLLPHPPAADGTPPAPRPARRLRGHSLQTEQAFQTGLAQAYAYHQLHGHLAVPKEDTPAGYPLGHGGRVPRRGRQRRRPPLRGRRAGRPRQDRRLGQGHGAGPDRR
ncbi:helicase associated domain-containing protein [Streptomyces sp. MA15]|uniref:helicase associated domain-containing protein n=1 Tax=Streptomyces sp. MA15 TaxID=3055061 RepID=UPI00339D9E5F